MDERKPLRLQFKHLLDDERLDDHQYSRLRRKLEGSEGDETEHSKSPRTTDGTDSPVHAANAGKLDRWSRTSWMVAATILLFLAVMFVLRILPIAGEDSNVPRMIAEEVATNHIKIHNPDLETSSLDDIRVYFDRLDFVPAGSDLIDQSRYALKGARYCTLQGKIAAHLMFDSPLGDNVSHYQAAYDPSRFGPIPNIDNDESPQVFTSRGVEVEIWVERDLLMARARTVHYDHDAIQSEQS